MNALRPSLGQTYFLINPSGVQGVTPGMTVGVNTEVIAGEGLIITTGGMDAHVHFICPQICDEVGVPMLLLLFVLADIRSAW